jgi:hypothetical protein
MARVSAATGTRRASRQDDRVQMLGSKHALSARPAARRWERSFVDGLS